MKIWITYIGRYGWDVVEETKSDQRLKFYEDGLYCLDDDKEDIEKQYNLKFVNASYTLFYEFLQNNDVLFDADWQFEYELELWDFDKSLFYYNFDQWLQQVRSIYNNVNQYIVNNYDRCKENYIKLIALRLENS